MLPCEVRMVEDDAQRGVALPRGHVTGIGMGDWTEWNMDGGGGVYRKTVRGGGVTLKDIDAECCKVSYGIISS